MFCVDPRRECGGKILLLRPLPQQDPRIKRAGTPHPSTSLGHHARSPGRWQIEKSSIEGASTSEPRGSRSRDTGIALNDASLRPTLSVEHSCASSYSVRTSPSRGG